MIIEGTMVMNEQTKAHCAENCLGLEKCTVCIYEDSFVAFSSADVFHPFCDHSSNTVHQVKAKYS